MVARAPDADAAIVAEDENEPAREGMRRRKERETDPGYQEFLGMLAENVRKMREARRLSQEALAEQAGVDIRTVQRLEAGTLRATVQTLYFIANAMGLEPEELLRQAE